MLKVASWFPTLPFLVVAGVYGRGLEGWGGLQVVLCLQVRVGPPAASSGPAGRGEAAHGVKGHGASAHRGPYILRPGRLQWKLGL